MKRETETSLDEQRRMVAYLDGLHAKVNALRELQSASGKELSALMPSILDKAFKVSYEPDPKGFLCYWSTCPARQFCLS